MSRVLRRWQAYFDKGLALIHLDRHLEAVASFDRVLELIPSYAPAFFHKGRALASVGMYNEAVFAYNINLEITPDDPEVLYHKGLSLAHMDKHEEAIAAFEAANKTGPVKSDTWYQIGLSHASLGQHNDAVNAFARALEIDPGYNDAIYHKGLSLAELGNFNDAISSISRALEVSPGLANAWLSKGFCLFAIGNYQEAVISYDGSRDAVLPAGWTTWKIWQYTGKGRAPGIAGGVDLNWFNGSYDDLLKYCQEAAPKPIGQSAKAKTTLNIRNGAGINYQDIGDLLSGAEETIGKVDGTDVWVQIDANKWIALAFKGERNARTETGSGGLQVRVTADALNIRSGPGIEQTLVGQLKKDAVAPLRAVDGKDVWGEIEPGKWIAIAFRGNRYVDFV